LFLHEPQGVAIWRKLHSEFFSQFTSGAHIVTANSGHNIHREEPQLVVSAINQVIQAATKQKAREEHEAKMAQLGNKLTEATTYLTKRKEKQAEALVFDALKSSGFEERTINTIAYQQLSKPESMAIAALIFKYNTVQFAESANAFDSYGEALMQQGKLKLAEQQFNKAIELATINQDASTLKNSRNNLEKISQLMKKK
jgi:Tfp pilus assembly protein PilF